MQNSESRIQNSEAVVVTGMGLLSCLGNLQETWNGLLAGKSGIELRRPFAELPAYPLGLSDRTPRFLEDLTQLLVSAALQDAKLSSPLPDCGVVIGSSRGCQGNWERLATDTKDTPDLWLNTLPDRAAVATAEYLGTRTVLAPMAACATGILAIARAYELVATGQCPRAIAGAVEAPITRLSLAGFERMGALATTGCYPFDLHREGLVLAEGGAILVLETANAARKRQVPLYGKILGFGLTCDAHHISSPDSLGKTAAIAIKQCLARSNLKPDEIDYIHAHGTSTQLNDRHEAQLIQDLFPPTVAVSSTKGATGHTLGGSGAIGTALCLMAIDRGYLPPCVGLREPEFKLNLVRRSQQAKIDNALCFSFGFGGQNAVLAIGRS
jgi:3-oxoacyl-[acyl-carrier-protein] synthase II